MTDQKTPSHSFARSRSNAGLGMCALSDALDWATRRRLGIAAPTARSRCAMATRNKRAEIARQKIGWTPERIFECTSMKK